MIDANAGLVERDTDTLAFGLTGAHDRVSAGRLDEMEFNFVALAARQIDRADNRHVGTGLLAHDFGDFAFAGWHLADHAIHGGIALHGLSEQPRSLDKLSVGRSRSRGSFGHYVLLNGMA